METAIAMGFHEVFLFTTQAFDWFRQLGFEQADINRLPEERRRTYDVTRRSRVMFRDLSATELS